MDDRCVRVWAVTAYAMIFLVSGMPAMAQADLSSVAHADLSSMVQADISSTTQTGLSSSQIRSGLLYRVHEFSPHVQPSSRLRLPHSETADRQDPFDARAQRDPMRVRKDLRGVHKNPSQQASTRVRHAPTADDKWIAFDKVQHLTFSFLWTLGSQYMLVNKSGLSEHGALPLSVTSSALAGTGKEFYDLRSGPPNVFSYRDIVADAAGILLAVGVILL